MGSELSVRRCRPADHDRVLQLHIEPMDDVDAFVEGRDELDADLADIESAYIDEGGDFLVGEFDGRIVSMGGYKPPSEYFAHFLDEVAENAVEITRMRVESAYQGRGFGERVYDELERRARLNDVETLLLDTTHRQKAAQGLYEKKGFREIKRQEVELDGEQFTMIFYTRQL